MYDRVADGHADFERAAGARGPRRYLCEARDLRVGDGDAVLCGVLFHLGQEAHVRWQEAFEVLRLLAAQDCVYSRFHYLPSVFFCISSAFELARACYTNQLTIVNRSPRVTGVTWWNTPERKATSIPVLPRTGMPMCSQRGSLSRP